MNRSRIALLLAVADYLKSNGATIVAIAEQTSSAKLNKFAFDLWRSPSKLVQAIALRAKLLGVPYLADCWVALASNLRVTPLLTRGLPHSAFSPGYLIC